MKNENTTTATPKWINLSDMTIAQLAKTISNDWSKVNYAAKPYLYAMLYLESIHDRYFQDDGKTIVRYFLSNASTYRGELAREIKAELNKRLK
jgi:hypothetical protein